MAEHMGSYSNACFPPQPSKERVHICIGHRLACSRSLQFNEQVVRLNFYRVYFPNIGDNFINKIRRYINATWGMDCFDFRLILKRTAITDMNTIFRDINILDKKSQRLSYADG